MRIWRRKRKPFDQLVCGIVREIEASGGRLPEDRQAALSAMAQVIASVITLRGTFEGDTYGVIPSAEEWARAGRKAVQLVNGRRRR